MSCRFPVGPLVLRAPGAAWRPGIGSAFSSTAKSSCSPSIDTLNLAPVESPGLTIHPLLRAPFRTVLQSTTARAMSSGLTAIWTPVARRSINPSRSVSMPPTRLTDFSAGWKSEKSTSARDSCKRILRLIGIDGRTKSTEGAGGGCVWRVRAVRFRARISAARRSSSGVIIG